MSKVSLIVNGAVYSGWKSAQVVSSINQIATQFAVEVTRKYPAGSTRINPGDAVEILLDDDLICTGFVDATPMSFSGSSLTVSVSGRSKTVDLVDCSIDTSINQPSVANDGTGWQGVTHRQDGTKIQEAPAASEWSGIDVKKTIARLCGRYGIKLYDLTKKDFISKKVSVSKGTIVYQAINEIIKEHNLFITDSESGDLVLSESKILGAATDSIVVTLDGKGTNALEGSCDFDFSSVFSEYQVFGQSRPQDSDEPGTFYNVQATAKSNDLKRERSLHVFLDGDSTKKTCQDRANFEAKTRSADAFLLRYKVQGWRQSDGGLWRKGLTLKVRDEILNVSGNFLIESLTYDQGESGTFTTLNLFKSDSI